MNEKMTDHHPIANSRINKSLTLLSEELRNKAKRLKHNWVNKLKKPWRRHQAWHTLFNNKLPCEAMYSVEQGEVKSRYEKEYKEADEEQMVRLINMETSWRELFGNILRTKSIIYIIKKYWTPRTYRKKIVCFQFKICFQFHDPKKICPLLLMDKRGRLIKKLKGFTKINKRRF